jgi:hypothetical protein
MVKRRPRLRQRPHLQGLWSSPTLIGASILSASRFCRLRLFSSHRRSGSQVPYESPNESHASSTIWAIKISCTRFATPKWRLIGSRISGRTEASTVRTHRAPETARNPSQLRPPSIGRCSLDLRPSRHQGCCCWGANWVSDRDTVVFRGVACIATLDRRQQPLLTALAVKARLDAQRPKPAQALPTRKSNDRNTGGVFCDPVKAFRPT